MELQEMKNLWNATPQEQVRLSVLEKMTREQSQPVLRKFKLQLFVELVVWLLIIFFYYDAFDGDKRPMAINLVFVIGFLQAAAYNLSGYFAAKNLIAGRDLATSLPNYLQRLKRYKWTAIGSRAVLMLALLLFFSYGLEMEAKRLIAIAGIIVVFGLQLYSIYLIWNKRIANLSRITLDFE
jgi:hypothetical protein